jgi:hypothetical protein
MAARNIMRIEENKKALIFRDRAFCNTMFNIRLSKMRADEQCSSAFGQSFLPAFVSAHKILLSEIS